MGIRYDDWLGMERTIGWAIVSRMKRDSQNDTCAYVDECHMNMSRMHRDRVSKRIGNKTTKMAP